nr:unnamed protein product [Callosobruchus analis]
MDWGKKKTKPASSSASSVAPLDEDELTSLIQDLQENDIQPALARVLEPFASEMMKTPEQLLKGLDEVFREELSAEAYEDILKEALSFKFETSDNETIKIEKATRGQAQNSVWFKFRSGRVTASKFRAAARGKLERPPLSLIKGICYHQTNHILFKTNHLWYKK